VAHRVIGNYREFTIALAGTLLSVVLMLGLGNAGWPGDPDSCFFDRGGSGCYCEGINPGNFRASAVFRHPGLIAQPAGFWSALSFVGVGLLILWWMGWERSTERSAPHDNALTRSRALQVVFGALAAFVGLGTMLFHASLKGWGGWIDSMSMNAFMGFVLFYNLRRRFSLPAWLTGTGYGLVIVALGLLTALDSDNATLYFAGLGGLTLVSQVLVYWSPDVHTAASGWWWFFAATMSFLIGFVVWRLSWTGAPLCDPRSFAQGHAVWHLHAAAALGCLYMYFRAEDAGASVPDWMQTGVRIALGILVGGGIGYGSGAALGAAIDADTDMSVGLAVGFALFGALYSAIAFASRVYAPRFWAVVGYVLDLSWSVINTVGGLGVWIPACRLKGATFLPPTPESRRSGTFVYNQNPRGGGFGATTIGTGIAGGWSSHEEAHVWQARLFGPAYFVTYVLSFLLNFLAQLPFFRGQLLKDAYFRICWEEWAYWGGDVSGKVVHWGAWFGGLFLSLLYLTLVALIPVGIAAEEPALWVSGAVGLFLYTAIRAALPRGH
jgi:hypothetical protein